MSPRISVVLPVYNAGSTLDTAIKSILRQTETDFQFVIVNDGSTDNSGDIIRKWSNNDSRITPLFRAHCGIVSALNAGIQKSEGSYIARMDADDISLPSRLERQADHLDKNPKTGLVSCLVEHLGDQQDQKGYGYYVHWINSLASADEIRINRFIESPLAHPSVMFRRTLIEQFGDYRDGNFPEDYELWLRWLEHGVRMEKIQERLLQWRDEEDRLSRNHNRYSTDSFYKLKANYLARWLKANNLVHADIIVWGAGRTSRQRANLLSEHGICITHYIDVNPNKIGQKIHGIPILGPDEIPDPDGHFILSYVGSRGVNKKIQAHLEKRGYTLGKHFLFAA